MSVKNIKILVTIPIYNEEKILEKNVLRVYKFMKKSEFKNFVIIIANNGSTDNSSKIANKLSDKFDNIKHALIKRKGRGFAIKAVWLKEKADIYAYMDVDLASNLESFPKLLKKIIAGYDIVTGSRHLKKSKIKRSLHREICSRGYNLLVRAFFDTKICDMQCGFKAINYKIRNELLAKVEDNEWFFDTELILLGEHNRYKVTEIPIIWTGNLETKVEIIKTIIDYIKDLIKLKKRLKK